MVQTAAMIERFIESGHTVRAMCELRALLDATGFWDEPDPDLTAKAVYLESVKRFAERGITEADLRITLRA